MPRSSAGSIYRTRAGMAATRTSITARWSHVHSTVCASIRGSRTCRCWSSANQDVALRRCPITSAEALEMISEVKGARLLRGFRGKPAADIDALAETLVNVSHLAAHLDGQVAELDINPLMELPAGA